MTLSLYEGRRQRGATPLVVIQTVNLLFAAGCVFLWAALSLLIEDPMRWATSYGIGARPELFDYPFVLLWLMPVGGACAAWVAQQANRMTAAYVVACYPLAYIGLVVGWYYLAPPNWL